MTPTPPDEYFFKQITLHKKDISLLQTHCQALQKRFERLEKISLQQQEDIDSLQVRNSLPWWKRVFHA